MFDTDTDADESTGTVVHYHHDEESEDEDDFDDDSDSNEYEDDYKALAIKHPMQTKSKQNMKEIQNPNKISPKDDHEEEQEVNPQLTGLASHNVSVGEEDANQGTVEALTNFKALSLHTSPTSTRINPEPFHGFRFENTKFQALKIEKHPNFVTMIKNSITIIDKEKGVSIIAIKKWITRNHPDIAMDSLNVNMKKALKKGLEDGTFKRPSRSSNSLGSALTGSLLLGSAKNGLMPKPNIRKPVSKKTTKKPTIEKAKQELVENEVIKNKLDPIVEEEPSSKAKLPKKTKPKETAPKEKPIKTSKKSTRNKVDEKAQMPTANDEELENKENQSPVKQSKKKTTKTTKSKETVSKIPKVPKSKKAVEVDKVEKPLTRSAEKLAGVSRRLRNTK